MHLSEHSTISWRWCNQISWRWCHQEATSSLFSPNKLFIIMIWMCDFVSTASKCSAGHFACNQGVSHLQQKNCTHINILEILKFGCQSEFVQTYSKSKISLNIFQKTCSLPSSLPLKKSQFLPSGLDTELRCGISNGFLQAMWWEDRATENLSGQFKVLVHISITLAGFEASFLYYQTEGTIND